MTLRDGRRPRADRAGGLREEPARRVVVDAGWDDYIPPDPEEIEAERRSSGRRPSRDYRKGRSGGLRSILGFALITAVVGGLVVGGLYFVARPVVANGIVDWAAENPTALKLPFVSDIVRGTLWSSISQPVDATDATAVVIIVAAGATPRDIGDQLVATRVITDARAFVYEAIEKGATQNFQVGRHVVTRAMTLDQIIYLLTTPPLAPPSVRITFIEGVRIEQMVAKLELLEAKPADATAPLQMNPSQFYDLVEHPSAALVAGYPWLKLPAGASLEGFLFPATYDVAPDTTPDQLIGMLLVAFASHAPPGLLKLPPAQIYQIVQLASLVEKEAAVDSERALIAGVYENRLASPKWTSPRLLNADPTLLYAHDSIALKPLPIETWLNYSFWGVDWMKTSGPLSKVDFGSLAAYNTYSHVGLPPTPICSPGAASLVAAMAPDTADGYFYFLAKNDGTRTHAFAKTQAEQDANAKLYGYTQ